jgi:hypothetical protein
MNVVRALAADFKMDISEFQIGDDAILPLRHRDGNSFFQDITKNMHRTINRYRRSNQVYVRQVSIAEFREAAATLKGKAKLNPKPSVVGEYIAKIESMKRPLLVGVKTGGTWLSLGLGYYESAEIAYLMLQLNNESGDKPLSSSMLLRGYLIEQLIADGFRRLVFPAGIAGHLAYYANFYPNRQVYMDRATWGWRLFRHHFARVVSQLSKEVKERSDWIIPSESKQRAETVAKRSA